MAASTATPDNFRRAVEGLRCVRVRPEISLEEVPPPQRLAPFSYALSGTVLREDEEVATGRLILLHDPAGHEAWDGTMRLVTYVTAELEPELAADPLLPAVGWSWLTDALESAGAAYTAAGGTVTQTLSTRFGELAGPPTAADLEIRASWTPRSAPMNADRGGRPGETGGILRPGDLGAHLHAWCGLLASTAGLPPEGVTALPERRTAM